jgi:major membrane immunogen (membrane-anchored lipoprotein)
MKKIIAIILSTLMLIAMLTGCGNKDMWDTNYTYDKAIISMPDGTILEGKISNWTDYEDGDQIQVTIDGKVYLVHSSNIVLINE